MCRVVENDQLFPYVASLPSASSAGEYNEWRSLFGLPASLESLFPDKYHVNIANILIYALLHVNNVDAEREKGCLMGTQRMTIGS